MKNVLSFIWTNLNPLLPKMIWANSVWNWPSGSGLEDFKNLSMYFRNFAKGQCWIMSVRDTFDTCAKYGKPMSNQKIVVGQTWKHVKKPCKFDLKVKRIGNMNDTLSHGDTTMCKIWYVNVEPKKVMGRTRICRQTDRDSYIPPEFCSGEGGGGCIKMVHIRPPLCLSSFEVYFTHLLWKFIL